jgi:putative addiction module component (TIGR02574 family)
VAATKTEPTKADILEMAKKLTYDERSELVEELEATLHPPPPGPPMTKEEFQAELDRRWREHLADPSKARPVAEVLEEIRRKYRHHG